MYTLRLRAYFCVEIQRILLQTNTMGVEKAFSITKIPSTCTWHVLIDFSKILFYFTLSGAIWKFRRAAIAVAFIAHLKLNLRKVEVTNNTNTANISLFGILNLLCFLFFFCNLVRRKKVINKALTVVGDTVCMQCCFCPYVYSYIPPETSDTSKIFLCVWHHPNNKMDLP